MNERFPAVPPDVVDSGSTRRKNLYGRVTVSRKKVLGGLYVAAGHSMSARMSIDGDVPSHAALNPPAFPVSGYCPRGPAMNQLEPNVPSGITDSASPSPRLEMPTDPFSSPE